MASKEYFIKMSWQDPKQPLARVHANNTMYLDLTKDVYEVSRYAEQFQVGRCSEVEDFIIDFMIPTGNED